MTKGIQPRSSGISKLELQKKIMIPKIVTVLFAMFLFSLTVFGQGQPSSDETVTLRKSDLPPELLTKIEKKEKIQEISRDLRVAQEWSGIGKEIGVAVNEGLKAVTEQTANFAKTDVGKMTMFLIAWKVMAKDIGMIASSSLGFIVGVPLLIFANSFAVYYYRRTFIGRRVVKNSIGWLWWRKTEYEAVEPACAKWGSAEPVGVALVAFWIALFVSNTWIISGCIF